jgi:hypothetical protein
MSRPTTTAAPAASQGLRTIALDHAVGGYQLLFGLVAGLSGQGEVE